MSDVQYTDAFVEADDELNVIGLVHLVDWPTRTTVCGRAVGGSWVSRRPGLFYGARRKRNEADDVLCNRCLAGRVRS